MNGLEVPATEPEPEDPGPSGTLQPQPPRPVVDPAILAAEALTADLTGEEGLEELSQAAEAAAKAAAEASAGETEKEEDPEAYDDAEVAHIPLMERLEAVLFAATEPVSMARLRKFAACADPLVLRRALDALAALYRETGRAFLIEEVAGGHQLRTRPEMGPVLARMGRRPDTGKLSPAALETLAVVAYRQPVLRADIEKIRGVACGEVLRTLVERGLVRVAGRADLPGSPLLYGTTRVFLDLFGLRDLRELPGEHGSPG